MSIKVTENAINEVKRFKNENNLNETDILCIFVAGGGCSGFTYKMKVIKKDSITDRFNTYDFFGETIAVDKRSDLYLEKTTVDFFQGIEKRGFVFDNKAASGKCSCGSSFSM